MEAEGRQEGEGRVLEGEEEGVLAPLGPVVAMVRAS